MSVVLHGDAGGWDELLIALVAFGVMWVAVKLAGRRPIDEDDESEPEADTDAVDASAPAHHAPEPAPGPIVGSAADASVPRGRGD